MKKDASPGDIIRFYGVILILLTIAACLFREGIPS